MNLIRVQTAQPYQVLVGAGILPSLGKKIRELPGKRYHRAAIIADDKVMDLYGNEACSALAGAGFEVLLHHFPHGEESKTMDTVMDILEDLSEHLFTRDDLVVALGGGVTGDMAGFAAAIYQRGIDYVQVPTTLLAAIDSSVGGKTGVNLPQGKNLVGAFHQPQLVLCDTDTLSTLDAATFADGLAEVIKHGAIRDAELFELLETRDIQQNLTDIIARSVQIKAAVVAEDEHEHGLRQLLNFGHTLGHGIEKQSGYVIPHGSAVAIGMCLVADACVRHQLLSAGDADRLKALLELLGLPVKCPYPIEKVCAQSLGDKKRHGNTINLITLERIGTAAIYPVEADRLTEFFTR